MEICGVGRDEETRIKINRTIGSGIGETESALQVRKRDHISHFILRLAYCRSDELRRWFIAREVELFRLRFLSLNTEGVKSFLQKNNLDYIPISEDEKNHLKENLLASTFIATPTFVEMTDFFKVPFSEVLDLVRSRKVYLNSGYAYIPSTDLFSVIQTIFRTNLSHALVMTARQLPQLEEDERLHKFLGGLHHSYTGEDYYLNKDKAGIQPEQLDSLSKISFPLCMRQIHEHIRANHHARHGGRMQYGLFLKGIGVSLEDSLRFWREEFTKIMELDKFEKQHAYNVRHNYGKEGKRTNYTPYSCIKIIMSSVGPGDHHGCPFRHNDLAVLKQQMHSYNLPPLGIQEVAEYVSRGHYQLACGKYFELTHGVSLDSGINHPNQYFQESQKVLAAKHGVKNGSGDVESGSTGESLNSKPVGDKTKDSLWDESFDINSLSEQ
ncbi:DNA primase large subunit isoform X2 [Anabrus simplex]|uniref:DNA primase large subunit isoform X2 n=1 Tax=Anabrus simplex TaxID=316456 RepID=UPI0035A3CBFE